MEPTSTSQNSSSYPQQSEIMNFYSQKSIFITGATGFLGKVLLEKLLRSCYDLKRIYVLVRHKKGSTPAQRLNELVGCKLFENVKQCHPEFKSKLEAIEGDLVEPNMGISPDDEKRIVENVSIVFHSAATIRFDEPLKVAVEMNIIGTKAVIVLSKKLKNLEVLVHVSTAYANCDRQCVSEVVYNPPISPEKIIEVVERADSDLVDQLTLEIIKYHPNTYTFTKAITEYLVLEECKDIPCVIVRPSIVGSSWREPFPGWIDNFNGPTAVFVAIGQGISRSFLGNSNYTADLIPVDVIVNFLIASAWYTATRKPTDIKVYNYTTGQIKPLTWGMIERYSLESLLKNPLENMVLVPGAHFTSSKSVKFMRHIFEESVPSHIMDFYLKVMNKKTLYVRLQSRIQKTLKALEFFTTRQWEFTNDNVYKIISEMNELDNKVFNVDVRELNWKNYIENYCLGTKKYLLKEDMSNMNKCRQQLLKLKLINNFVLYSTFVVFLLFFILQFIY